jgi:predicted nucleic acid-binding Zn ribbon protein
VSGGPGRDRPRPRPRDAGRDRDGRDSRGDRRDRDPEDEDRVKGMERLADLLPAAAREYGLEEQLEQARLAAAWLRIVAERVPAAADACRLIDFRQDVATIQADLPIVAQEIRLRSPELLAALRNAARVSVRQLRVVTRHV